MQASLGWVPPTGTLGEILAATRIRVAALESRPSMGPGRSSRPALAASLRQDTVAVIAEVKRKSPSKGEINPGLGAGAQAARYEAGGAAAVSILTEPSRFGGDTRDLDDAAGATRLPLIKKDFHIATAQVAEAAASPASAILLIARAVPPETLLELMAECGRVGLEALVQVRSEDELDLAVSGGATIIGVNSRDLETLEVDESVPDRLIPRIPAGIIAVWESGVKTVEDVRRAARAGADAVLVGSELSRSADPEGLVRSLAAVPREARRG